MAAQEAHLYAWLKINWTCSTIAELLERCFLELDTLHCGPEDEPHRSWRHVVPSDGVGVT